MKNSIFAVAIAAIMLLGGCSEAGVYSTSYDDIIKKEKALSGCSVYSVSNGNGSNIIIVRCPNSTTSTTYKSGKTTQTTVVAELENLNAQIEELSLKRNALEKLTEEEKKALGIEVK